MQAQAPRQEIGVCPQQSMAIVKTLLNASFGCITYLRNLLPEDNFSEARLTAGERGSMTYDSSQQSNTSSRHVSSVAVKTVNRGFSSEADKLLNYLENGIFHAIERQYLKSFIFAIYLDHDDPNNIIEAYTYRINYYEVPGTGTIVPVLSLDDQLKNMSLRGKPATKDPIAVATMNGRAPTLREVKESLRTLIKHLVVTIQALEPLPKRRYAMFKLFYRENTPTDYEPPYFRPGDPEKDKFVFMTHGKSEIPERFSVGSVNTPFHCVDLEVQSIAKYIPACEEDGSQFTGLVPHNRGERDNIILAPGSMARVHQREVQHADAQRRNVVWSAENRTLTDSDASGELDPELVNDSGISLPTLLGVRKEDGEIHPMETEDVEMAPAAEQGERQYFGATQEAPSDVGKLIQAADKCNELEETQRVESTQQTQTPHMNGGGGGETVEGTNINTVTTCGVDTQALVQGILAQNDGSNNGTPRAWAPDHEMLNLETQVEAPPFQSQLRQTNSGASVRVTDNRPGAAGSENPDDVDCLCTSMDADDLVQCDGECQRWYHLWCMGYHSPEDDRLPENFVCIPCRLKSDPKFYTIEDKYPTIELALKELAAFRRVIKIVEEEGRLMSRTALRKLLSCSPSNADIFWRRLQSEGFIVEEEIETDQTGLLESRVPGRPHNSKGKSKQSEMKKRSRPPACVFNKDIVHTEAYRKYFSPESEAELEMIGLHARKSKNKKSSRGSARDTNVVNADSAIVSGVRYSDSTIQSEHDAPRGGVKSTECVTEGEVEFASQTQDDTQFPVTDGAAGAVEGSHADPTGGPKRRHESESTSAKKKCKISIGEGVDMEE